MQQRDNCLTVIILTCVASPQSGDYLARDITKSHLYFNMKMVNTLPTLQDENSVAGAQMPDKLWSRTISTRSEPGLIMLNFSVSPVFMIFCQGPSVEMNCLFLTSFLSLWVFIPCSLIWTWIHGDKQGLLLSFVLVHTSDCQLPCSSHVFFTIGFSSISSVFSGLQILHYIISRPY